MELFERWKDSIGNQNVRSYSMVSKDIAEAYSSREKGEVQAFGNAFNPPKVPRYPCRS